jgi:endoglucanase
MKIRNFYLLTAIVCLMACNSSSNQGYIAQEEVELDWSAWPADSGSALGSDYFIQVSGEELITPDGNPFQIKGIAFGNQVWGNPQLPTFTHHGPEDYSRIKELGFNSVRFYLNYGIFEDDNNPYHYKENGFRWLDANVAAARAQGIYLILNMHYPQGGFQSTGGGDALWEEGQNQQRLIALWQEIARRYKDEQQIIGYGLVNEPVPTENIDQWQKLAQGITTAIRQEDSHHILFIERALYAKQDYGVDENYNFIEVEDPSNQWVLEFHFYDPMAVTHQNASWVESLVGKFAQYPDENALEIHGTSQWMADLPTEHLASGNTDWMFFQSDLLQIESSPYNQAMPALQAGGLGDRGKVWFDDILIEEFDSQGNLLGTI